MAYLKERFTAGGEPHYQVEVYFLKFKSYYKTFSNRNLALEFAVNIETLKANARTSLSRDEFIAWALSF